MAKSKSKAKKKKTSSSRIKSKKKVSKNQQLKGKKGGKKKVAKKVSKKTAKKDSVARTKVSLSANAIEVGQGVPELSLAMTGGQPFQLSSYKGRRLVLYFYPKDATPGCTIEGHDFTRLHQDFKNLNADILGVSRDTIDSHEKFKSKECYSLDLVSDPEEKLCQTFGVIKMKNMYGKQVRGIERSTFIIDEQGRLEKEWRAVKVEGHAAEVLDYIRSKV